MPATRLLLGVALLLVLAGCQTPRADPAAPGARLGSAVFKFEALAAMPDAAGLRREVVNQPTATLARFECHFTTLNPGLRPDDPPRQPQEELLFIKEGTLRVAINGRAQTVGTGSVAFFASNDLHRLENIGATPATYLEVTIATAATRSAPAAGAAVAALPGRLPSGVYDWRKLAILPLPTGGRRDLISSPTVTCMNLDCRAWTLVPGASPNPPHHHPDESFIVVKDGVLDVTLGGVTQRVGPGGICFFASNELHGVKNASPTPVTYYAIHLITAATPPMPAQ